MILFFNIYNDKIDVKDIKDKYQSYFQQIINVCNTLTQEDNINVPNIYQNNSLFVYKNNQPKTKNRDDVNLKEQENNNQFLKNKSCSFIRACFQKKTNQFIFMEKDEDNITQYQTKGNSIPDAMNISRNAVKASNFN